jgi:hypothetical protein
MPGGDERDTVESIIERLEESERDKERLQSELDDAYETNEAEELRGNDAIDTLIDMQRFINIYRLKVNESSEALSKALDVMDKYFKR